MAALLSKGPRVAQKPDDLLSRSMQSRTSVNVAQVLSSNALVLDGSTLQDWQTVLQTYWQLLLEPEENPTSGGSHHLIFPEEPSGRGGRTLLCLPTEPGAMGEDQPSFDIEDIDDEVCTLLPVFIQEPIEDERRPTLALVWTFDGTNLNGTQQFVEVPSLGGDGYRIDPETLGGAGGDRVPTVLVSSGQDDDGGELARLLQAFCAVPSYAQHFADGREVW